MAYPLEPDRAGMEALGRTVLDRAIDFVEGLPDRPAAPGARAIDELLTPPPEHPAPLGDLLARLDRATAAAVETAGPSYLAYIPAGGLFASAVADLYARATNRYSTVTGLGLGHAALEESVVRWLCDLCGLPPGAGGVLLPGGSLANLSAVVTARHAGLGEDIARGTLYVSEHAHVSMAKAARMAGLPAAAVRTVPCTPELRMDVSAAARLIAADRAAGRRPFLLVGTAGTTNTGAIDPLPALADLAAREELWLHVDAAYGGPFRLTARGRDRLAGLERADSITLDPHKGLFMPYGTGALVVRDPAALRAAHEVDATYMQDLSADAAVPEYAALSPELTREARGLRIWLPLHLHGVAAFRDALDEKLDLTRMAHERLAVLPGIEVPWEPELSIVAFRAGSDAASRRLHERINASGRVFTSSTRIDGRFTLRLAILSFRTRADRVEEALDLIGDGLLRAA